MKIINPIIVYLSTWFLVCSFYSLRLTTNLEDPNIAGVALIGLNLLSICVIYQIFCKKRLEIDSSYGQPKFYFVLKQFLNILATLWIVGTCIDIYYSGGVPFLWSLYGSNKLYTEFGIPSFHGIVNAIYLQLLTLNTYVGLRYRKKIYIFITLVLLIWPVLMLGRGILLCGLVQITCVVFYFYNLRIKHIVLGIASVFFIVVAFGYVGDLRQTTNPFFYLVKIKYLDLFEVLPTGFLWFYVYMTAGLSNFFANIDLLAMNFQFTYSFSNLLPSILKQILAIDPRNDAINFVDLNLNTSTVYAGFISDFGVIGGFVGVCIIQACCCSMYSLLQRGKVWGVMGYSVCFQVLIFTVFYDMFFLLPTLFQFIICLGLYQFVSFSKKSRSV